LVQDNTLIDEQVNGSSKAADIYYGCSIIGVCEFGGGIIAAVNAFAS
jgi:hypothetical protein